MTITPEQADRMKRDATDGPWMLNPQGCILVDDGTDDPPGPHGFIGTMWKGWDQDGEGNGRLMAAAPDLAQTIAGMTVQWGVERDLPGTAYIDGQAARTITWVGDEARARKACVISPRGGNPRLVRRLVGPTEPITQETKND